MISWKVEVRPNRRTSHFRQWLAWPDRLFSVFSFQKTWAIPTTSDFLAVITLKILDQIFVSSTYRKQGSSFFSCLYNEFVVDRKKYYVHSKEKKYLPLTLIIMLIKSLVLVSHINLKKSRENYLKTKISHRPFRGCESTSQIGSDRKLGKCQISISKQMYHTVTLLMEIINISSLDFYFGESTRLFISPRTRVKKLGAAPRGLQPFTHHLN